MALRNLHTDWNRAALNDLSGNAATSYQEARNNLIKIAENSVLFAGDTTFNGQNIQTIHGVRGNPTIGYGFDLSQNAYSKIETFITAAFGGALSVDQQVGLALIADYKDPQGALTAAQLIDIAQGRGGTSAQQAALGSRLITSSRRWL